jgi:hypothetical protein
MKRPACLALLLLLGGCAYYNGMYNAKRLAGRARQAEKEGRTFDATSLWGQVGVKAESVLAQHPTSKWSDEARLLQATSLIKLRNCAVAVRPLEAVVTNSKNETLAEEAAILLGSCRTTLGDPMGAMAAYSRLTASKNPGRRRLALFAHGKAQRINGNYAEALGELSGTDYPGAAGERAAALAGLGRLPEALAMVDTLLAGRDTLTPWDSLVAAVGRRDPAAAAALTDRINQTEGMPPGLRARLFVADASRWRVVDVARSEERLHAAEQVAEGTPIAAEARLAALLVRLQAVDSLAQLNELIDRIEELSEGSGPVAPRAAQLAGFARKVALAADSVPVGSPRGDLRLFIAGEMARDSLLADRFAARQFRRVVTEWPASPFAPKAILALILLQPERADSLRVELLVAYPGSPYLAMIEGGDSPEYIVLEDSLRRFANGFRPEGRRAPPPPRENRTGAAPREPVNR